MQGDPGLSDLLVKKRKSADSSSRINTSDRGKKARKSNSPTETGEAEKAAEPQWPDYFNEVSTREDSS
jgi:hypothetical protein